MQGKALWEAGRSCSLLQGTLTALGLVLCGTRDRRSQTGLESVTSWVSGRPGSSRTWSPGQHKKQVELFQKPRATNWGGGTALAAVPGIPTCHGPWEALLDGVVQQLSPLRWEPEQNQRKAQCHWDIALAPGTEAWHRGLLTASYKIPPLLRHGPSNIGVPKEDDTKGVFVNNT